KWHEDRRAGWLILSSLLLALSILTKLFTAVLVPVWFLGILLDSRGHNLHSKGRLAGWKPPVLWLSVLVALGGLVVRWLVGPQNLGQLIDAHLVASSTNGFPNWSHLFSIGGYLGPSLPILFLAVVGTYRGIVSSNRIVLYLAGWMVGGGLFLILNRPTWYHHQLLITVPAAILAAIAVASALRDLVSWRRRPPAPLDRLSIAVTLVLLATVLLRRVPDTLETLDLTLPNLGGPPPMVSEEQEILALMWNHAAETDWVYTDRPIFAFAIGRPVPPKLAVLTEKRLVTGNLTGSQILSELETYSPRMILEGQFDIPAVDEYMFTRNFARLDSTVGYRLYLKPSVP
ncbi:MAG TPA: hypothetical protein VLL77_07120, partial [Anaerolineales bacterium]|nr:hypothetical protein [Anaerolineales bacterium]